jgi:hypothetical protein
VTRSPSPARSPPRRQTDDRADVTIRRRRRQVLYQPRQPLRARAG